MQVRIEFYGIARSRAGASEWTFETHHESQLTLGQLLLAAGRRFPGLARECFDGDLPAAGYTVNLNGECFVRAPETKLANGDCLLLLSADAGG